MSDTIRTSFWNEQKHHSKRSQRDRGKQRRNKRQGWSPTNGQERENEHQKQWKERQIKKKCGRKSDFKISKVCESTKEWQLQFLDTQC